MEYDLSEILRNWPFDPEDSVKNFRRIRAKDGRELIQVREPMGVQQMEYDGRPDGVRIEGMETWLAYYESQSALDPMFKLNHEQCINLMQEGILFYQRYLVLYQMEDWIAVVRDTGRNIEYFEFIREHAENREDWMTIEQYRPYILRMNAVAKSHILREGGEHEAAIKLLRRTLYEIQSLDPVNTPVFKMEMEKASKHLEQVIQELETEQPENEMDRLQKQKTEAIRREDFEAAARLRDEIMSLENRLINKN